MGTERRATAQCFFPARNVVDEKTLGLKITTQHGGESHLVFHQQDPRPVGVRHADIPHAEEPITRIKEIGKPVSSLEHSSSVSRCNQFGGTSQLAAWIPRLDTCGLPCLARFWHCEFPARR